MAAPAARRESDGDNYPPKGRKPVRGAKESFLGAKTARASNGIKDGRRRINFIGGRFRRESAKSVCGSVCASAFGVRKRLRCLRAVGLRPDLTFDRMRSYAPYALPLKGKGPKKVQLPKEVHKVHTASCMSSQPYSRLASCSSRKSAYGLHTAAYEVHTDA